MRGERLERQSKEKNDLKYRIMRGEHLERQSNERRTPRRTE